MNITFINPPTDNPYPKPPLGLLQVATACNNAGYNAQILDADLLKLSCDDIIQAISKADIIGITSMSTTIDRVLKLAALVKGELGMSTMIGGCHASIYPDVLFDTGLFDAVVMREGELSVVAAVRAIEQGKPPTIFESGILQYDYIPVPDYNLIDVASYRPRYPHGLRTPWTAVHASRGCPYHCTFCSKAVFGNKYRAMPGDDLYSLVDTLYWRHGIADITFYDDEFPLHLFRLTELCRLLIDNQLDLTWTCESRVSSVSREKLCMMREAGCRLIYFGIESGNQDILDTLGKGITLDGVRRAVGMCHDAGIDVAAYFMLGCPGETTQSTKDTIAFADELELEHAQFSICTPLPGSALYEQCVNGASSYLGNGARPVFVQGSLADYVMQTVVEANKKWAR